MIKIILIFCSFGFCFVCERKRIVREGRKRGKGERGKPSLSFKYPRKTGAPRTQISPVVGGVEFVRIKREGGKEGWSRERE